MPSLSAPSEDIEDPRGGEGGGPQESPGQEAAWTTSKAQEEDHPSFDGVWRRERTEGYEGLIRALKGGYMMRKVAAKIQMVHTIAQTPETLRLMEVGGPIRSDQTLAIGGEEMTVEIAGKTFVQRCFWSDDGKALVVRRRFHDEYELDFARTLLIGGAEESNERKIKLEYAHKDLKTGVETTAWAWFAYRGPHDLRLLAKPEPRRAITEPPAATASPARGASRRFFSSADRSVSSMYFDARDLVDGELGRLRRFVSRTDRSHSSMYYDAHDLVDAELGLVRNPELLRSVAPSRIS